MPCMPSAGNAEPVVVGLVGEAVCAARGPSSRSAPARCRGWPAGPARAGAVPRCGSRPGIRAARGSPPARFRPRHARDSARSRRQRSTAGGGGEVALSTKSATPDFSSSTARSLADAAREQDQRQAGLRTRARNWHRSSGPAGCSPRSPAPSRALGERGFEGIEAIDARGLRRIAVARQHAHGEQEVGFDIPMTSSFSGTAKTWLPGPQVCVPAGSRITLALGGL